jgi:hypothetical protein
MKASEFFDLEHDIYDIDEEVDGIVLGLFSSIEKAEAAIIRLKDKPGFRDFPVECFKILDAKIDLISWCDGFISWDEANEID